MSINNSIGRSLSMFKTLECKAVITLKSKNNQSFIARVLELDVSQEDTQIIFSRCEETIFPDDTESDKKEQYIISIEKIKGVELLRTK